MMSNEQIKDIVDYLIKLYGEQNNVEIITKEKKATPNGQSSKNITYAHYITKQKRGKYMNDPLLKVLEILGKEINNLQLDCEIKDYEINKLKQKIKDIENHIDSYMEGNINGK